MPIRNISFDFNVDPGEGEEAEEIRVTGREETSKARIVFSQRTRGA